MFGIRAHSGSLRTRGTSGFTLLLVLCFALIALLAMAQVAHLHMNSADADHCQLCITLQSAAPLAMAAMLVVMVALGSSVRLLPQRVALRPVYSRLYSRPPPSGR